MTFTLEKVDGTLIVLADHGNADQMVELNKDGTPKLDAEGRPKRRTSHSLNPVPFVVCGRDYAGRADLIPPGDYGLSDIAPTILYLLGIFAPDEMDGEVLISR